MPNFIKLDKNSCRLLKDINKIYKQSNYYSPKAKAVFADKYIGLDPTLPNDLSEKTQKELLFLAKLGYIEDENSPIPTQYGLNYCHYCINHYLEKFVIPTTLSLFVSLVVNLILNYAGIKRLIDTIINLISKLY